MLTALFIFLGGMLTRADGWGPANDQVAATWPKWQRWLCDFFNVWSCGGLFAVLALIYTGAPLTSLIAGLAFVAWRLPGFNGWEKWLPMFWRGAWTAAIGFTALSLVVHHHPYFGVLALAMGVAEMIAYSGSYKWLPGRVPDWAVHVIAEISSGVAFTGLVCIILGAA